MHGETCDEMYQRYWMLLLGGKDSYRYMGYDSNDDGKGCCGEAELVEGMLIDSVDRISQ